MNIRILGGWSPGRRCLLRRPLTGPDLWSQNSGHGEKGPQRGEPIAAAAFKATCLELMDRVRQTGVDYVVTKHETPVAERR